jgi:polyphosphate glucokinase
MHVLVVDIGGTNVTILATGQKTPRTLRSGPTLTATLMVEGVKALARNWKYDAVAIGFPGHVVDGRIVSNPSTLGRGWVGFDFTSAFGCPVKLMNDAATQALGSYLWENTSRQRPPARGPRASGAGAESRERPDVREDPQRASLS